MASTLAHRPGTNSTSTSGSSGYRRGSVSSFPPQSRSPSHTSARDGPTPTPRGFPPHSVRDSNDSSNSPSTPSHDSSTRALKPAAARQQNRRLKSQYPADSSEKHVEYILVASFDIDRGSVMEHQYPSPISGDEHMLAALMLPDQAHVRSQDWTIFFLHKDTTTEEGAEEEAEKQEEKAQRRRRRRAKASRDDTDTQGDEARSFGDTDTLNDNEDDSGSDEEDDGRPEGPPLIYVLNLVNTKQDNTVKRGAVVKAMAICTRHSFLHIYKPLLLLALEEYFRAPVPETLASLYNAVNAMDLSLMPRLSLFERFILQASDAKDLFIEKFDQMIQQRMAEDASRNSLPSDDPPPQVLSPSKSSHKRYALPRDTHEFESRVLYNSVPVPIKVPTSLSPETVGDFSLIKLIQAFSTPHSVSPVAFPHHPHLTTSGPYTHPIIVLINALLTQKRIVFLGHNQPSGSVAEAVLAACALASGGLLRGFTRHAFPYTDLTKIDHLQKVPGFIAGVTNPAFANKPEWWDLLCDVPSGRMKISPKIEGVPVTEGLLFFQQQSSTASQTGAMGASTAGGAAGPSIHGAITAAGVSLSAGLGGSVGGPGLFGDPTGDNAFMASLLDSINQRHGESAIRSKFRLWVLKFTRLAAAFEECVYGASALYIGTTAASSPSGKNPKSDAANPGTNPALEGHGYVWPDSASKTRELAGNASRIEGWRSTRSYYTFITDHASLYERRPIKTLDLHHQHDRLRFLKMPPAASADIYLALCAVVASYDEICQFLTVVPESGGGLFYLSLALFHPRPDVRDKIRELLERIREHEAGRLFWAGMGRFAKLAVLRRQREGSDGTK
ncbi:hypothetical protein B0A49_13460 [Cryomyces minteri]|uniref:UDENN domain-containing protein n=1 Tax=Cryomyces minteri TaxID=331657 RepID=A0A4U0VKC1_9PEZI|nr:hypothetical protein B0A49_13460 [Cryomyces minteri]